MKKFIIPILLISLSCVTPRFRPADDKNTGFTGKTGIVVQSICGINLCRVRLQDDTTVWAYGAPFDDGELICQQKNVKEEVWYRCPWFYKIN